MREIPPPAAGDGRSRPVEGAGRTDLSVRVRRAERMDDPDLDPAEHRRALDGLARINGISRTAGHLWREIRWHLREKPDRPLRILDVACGGGDVARGLHRAAARDGWPVEVVGCDASPVAIRRARAAAAGTGVRFARRDLLRHGLPGGFDVICCSLFLHHLSGEEAGRFLRDARAAARRMVVVSDLVRSLRGFLLAWAGTRLLSRSPVVHFDGPASVEAAFTPAEVRALARGAGLEPVTLRRTFPQRFLLTFTRNGHVRAR